MNPASWSDDQWEEPIASPQWAPEVLDALQGLFAEHFIWLSPVTLVKAQLDTDLDGTPVLLVIYDHASWPERTGLRRRLASRSTSLAPGMSVEESLARRGVRRAQTRERVRDRVNYVRFNTESFPGEWHLVIVQVVGEALHAASWTEFTYADGSTQPGLCFFELQDDGKIVRITDFWPDPYELPAQRAHLVERY